MPLPSGGLASQIPHYDWLCQAYFPRSILIGAVNFNFVGHALTEHAWGVSGRS